MNGTAGIVETGLQWRYRDRIRAWFVASAVAILGVTGLAKVWSASAPTKILAVADPITGISFGHLMLAMGIVELCVAGICLFGKSQWLKLGLIAWLATNFVVYRLGLWWIEWKKPCSCMGDLTDALHLRAEVADNIMKAILAYLLVGSYGLMVWQWRVSKAKVVGGDWQRGFDTSPSVPLPVRGGEEG